MARVIRWAYLFLDRPAAQFEVAAEFWCAVTRATLSPRRGPRDEFATLLPSAADPHVKIQAVGGEGGVHLDLCVDDPAALAERAVGAGASLAAEHEDVVVLRSPGGQLFCSAPWHAEAVRAAPVAGSGVSPSRLDQVSIDVAPAAFPAEIAFWSALTGWTSAAGSRPEFQLVRPPEGFPLRLLIQRLERPRPTSAHCDLACSDIPAVRTRHQQLGARMVDEQALWTVMRDPAGGTYCLTARDPRTGGLP